MNCKECEQPLFNAERESGVCRACVLAQYERLIYLRHFAAVCALRDWRLMSLHGHFRPSAD